MGSGLYDYGLNKYINDSAHDKNREVWRDITYNSQTSGIFGNETGAAEQPVIPEYYVFNFDLGSGRGVSLGLGVASKEGFADILKKSVVLSDKFISQIAGLMDKFDGSKDGSIEMKSKGVKSLYYELDKADGTIDKKVDLEKITSSDITRLQKIEIETNNPANNNNNDNNNAVNEYDESGNVKSSKVYDDNGNLLYTEEYNYNNGELTHVTQYNNKGQKTQVAQYDENGKVSVVVDYDEESGLAKSYTENAYDENGELSQTVLKDLGGNVQNVTEYQDGLETKVTNYNDSGEIESVQEKAYDDNGNVTEIKDYDSKNRLLSSQVYDYNDAGKVETISYKDKTGNVTEKHSFNADGQVKSIVYFDDNQQQEFSKEFLYNQDGDMTRASYVDGSGKTVMSEIYRNGQMAQKNYYNADGDVTKTEKYSYNNKGQIFKKKEYDSDGELLGTTENYYNYDGSLNSQYVKDSNNKLRKKLLYNDGLVSRAVNYKTNGIIDSYETMEYNDAGQLAGKKVKNANGTFQKQVVYKYDNSGKLSEIINKGKDGSVTRRINLSQEIGSLNNNLDNVVASLEEISNPESLTSVLDDANRALNRANEIGDAEAIQTAEAVLETCQALQEELQAAHQDTINQAKQQKAELNDIYESITADPIKADKLVEKIDEVNGFIEDIPEDPAENVADMEARLEEARGKLDSIDYIFGEVKEFNEINQDGDEFITKDELITNLEEKFELRTDANENLKDFLVDQLIGKISSEDDKITKEEFISYLDIDQDGIVHEIEAGKFNAELHGYADAINNAKEWQADGSYGKVDWNQDGKFGNDFVKNNGVKDWYENFIAVHGDLDKFFKGFGIYFRAKNLERISNEKDNTEKDLDHREGYVSNGKITSHKIADGQYGFNITERDQSEAAGVDYNYIVWDKEKKAYVIGNDSNNDAELTAGEIFGIIENVGNRSKTSSPLTFDLNGNDKVDTTEIEKEYDINGDGKVDKTAWAGIGDGVLAFDADNDGQVGEDGRELFGNNTDIDGDGQKDGFNNGFEALKALAEKYLGSQAISDSKLDFNELRELERKANLEMMINELNNDKEIIETRKRLTDLGITEISLDYTEVDEEESQDENGNEHRQIGDGFVMNGETHDVNDVWFRYISGE